MRPFDVLLLALVSIVSALSEEMLQKVRDEGFESPALVTSFLGRDFAVDELEDFARVYHIPKRLHAGVTLLPETEAPLFTNMNNSCYISTSLSER